MDIISGGMGFQTGLFPDVCIQFGAAARGGLRQGYVDLRGGNDSGIFSVCDVGMQMGGRERKGVACIWQIF